jgi:hypothetical protein
MAGKACKPPTLIDTICDIMVAIITTTIAVDFLLLSLLE